MKPNLKAKQRFPKKSSKSRRRVVPWMSKKEWISVHDRLFSTKYEDKKSALNQIAVWKSRSHPEIPLGIDVTAALVRACIADYELQQFPETQYKHHDVSMLYGMALARFINLIIDAKQGKSSASFVKKLAVPLHLMAEQMDIPLWLIDLRHDVVHSNFPPLKSLQVGAQIALQWIEKYYWKTEHKSMSDVILKQRSTDFLVIEEKFMEYLEEFLQVKDYGKNNVKKIAAQQPLQHFLSQHCQMYYQELSEVIAYNLLLGPSSINQVKHIDIEGGIWSEELKLVRAYWMPFLSLISQKSYFVNIFKCFMQAACLENNLKSILATSWLHAFLSALQPPESQHFHEDYHIPFLMPSLLKSSDWKILLTAALDFPNKYTNVYLPLIFEMVEPSLTEDQKRNLESLVDIFTCPYSNNEMEGDQTIAGKYYTTNDLNQSNDNTESHSPWKLCTDNTDWSQYPLGLIKGQNREELDLGLPSFVDKIFQHEAVSNETPHCFNINPVEEDLVFFKKPDLEARLEYAKGKATDTDELEWTENDIEIIKKNVAVF